MGCGFYSSKMNFRATYGGWSDINARAPRAPRVGNMYKKIRSRKLLGFSGCNVPGWLGRRTNHPL